MSRGRLFTLKGLLPNDQYQQYVKGIEAFERGYLLIEMMYDDAGEADSALRTPSRFFVAGYLDALRESLDV